MEPEAAKRIAELERQLAEAMSAAQAEERGSVESAEALGRIVELTSELGQVLQTDAQPRPGAETTERADVFGGVVESPHSQWAERLRRIPGRVGILVAVVIAILGVAAVSAINANRGADTTIAVDSDTANVVTTVPRGGQLRVGANLGAKRMIACNDGNLTLYGTGIFTITGHCASLTTGAARSQVSVEHADSVNITGYDSEYFITGHGAALTVTNNGNEVNIDSVDSVNISGSDNTVIYETGSPGVADKGQGNRITKKQ